MDWTHCFSHDQVRQAPTHKQLYRFYAIVQNTFLIMPVSVSLPTPTHNKHLESSIPPPLVDVSNCFVFFLFFMNPEPSPFITQPQLHFRLSSFSISPPSCSPLHLSRPHPLFSRTLLFGCPLYLWIIVCFREDPMKRYEVFWGEGGELKGGVREQWWGEEPPERHRWSVFIICQYRWATVISFPKPTSLSLFESPPPLHHNIPISTTTAATSTTHGYHLFFRRLPHSHAIRPLLIVFNRSDLNPNPWIYAYSCACAAWGFLGGGGGGAGVWGWDLIDTQLCTVLMLCKHRSVHTQKCIEKHVCLNTHKRCCAL